MKHLLKRLVSSTLAFFLSGAALAPLARAAGNPYLEHPIEDASYWSNYYKNHPELLNKLRFGDGGGQYLYDRLNQKMVNGYQFTDTTVPFTYSVYDENGSQLASTSVRPVIPGPPKLFLSAIPMDYQNKYWQWGTDRKEQIEVDPRHETERNPDDYHFGKSGNRFKKARDNFDDIEAHWVYSGHMTDPIHFDEKYANINFCLTYGYDIRILSKSVWPVKYVEDTFFVPISSTGSIRTDTYEGELYKIKLREEQKANVHEVYDDGEYTYQEGYSYYEIELAGKRSFVKERNRQSSKLKNHEKLRHTPSGKKGYYTYRDVKSLDALAEKDYYVIDDLEAMPGYYYCIHIHTLDTYHETAEAHGAGTVRPEAAAVLAEYNRLKPIVTEKLVKELAALKPVVSFSPSNGTSGKPPVVQEKTTHAETTPGEDKGVDIKPEVFTNPGEDEGVPLDETVAVSVGGALIGAGLAGLSRNKRKKKKKKNEKEEKKAAPTYKMYVSKGFGDAIQRGAAPVKVYARIAQVVEGKEYGCPELTAKIQASGSHLTVKPIGIENGCLCAEVSAAVDEAAKEADVIFTLAGAGGAFVRKIIFRLTGNPEIKFPALSEDGKNWLMDAGLDTVDMIAGGRGRDRLRFVFQDAATEPTDIQFLDADGFDISYEKDAGKPFTYYACIQNRTMLIPKESKVFADPVARTITIEATFSGKLKVRGQFTINLYPEGLFVFIIPDDPEWSHDARLCQRSQGLPEILVQGRMEVVSWKKPRLNGIVDEEIPPLFFVPCYAYEKADGRTVVVRESRCFTAGKFQPTDTPTGNILAKYRCKIGPIGEKAFCIQPQDILVEGEDAPYHVTLPFSVRHDGRSARADIPIRLVGESIDTTMVEWEKEYKNLQRRIIQFSVPEDIDMWIRLLKERATEPRCSVEDLHLVSRQIVAVYVDYWTKQREADYAEIARYDNVLYWLDWVKFIGDCAFSYLMNAFAGPVADAIITPAKDIFFYSAGELYACYNQGTKFDYRNLEIAKIINDAGDNVAVYFTTEGVKANLANVKKMAVYIAGYYVIAVIRNYTITWAKEGKTDWYGAFKDAFKDLSVNAFKAIAAELFMKWLKSEHFQEKLGKTLQDYLNKQFRARFRQRYPTYNIDFNSRGITITRTGTPLAKVYAGPKVEKTSVAECITKFLSELLGLGWGYVHEGVYDWAEHKARTSQLFFNEHGQLVFCFRLWEGEGLRPLYCELVLQKVILYSANPLGFFAYLYEMFFGSLIGAPAITFPKDPPFKRYDKKVWEEEYRHNLPSSRFRGLISQSKSKSPSDTGTGDSSSDPGEA